MNSYLVKMQRGPRSQRMQSIFLIIVLMLVAQKEKLKEWYNGITNKKDEGEKTTETFDQIIGIEDYKDEILDLVEYLKNPTKFQKMGAELPRGILLAGPPGTGKTLLARALANESGCKFFYKSGADVDKIFVGSGAKAIRELFQKAREFNGPVIIFFDEIDSFTKDRTMAKDFTSSFSTINQLLAEMDGFRNSKHIIVIGATNMPDKIDKALMRPGRFDKTITLTLPDVKGREKLFEYYAGKIKTAEKIDTKFLAQRSSRMSAADISTIVNKTIIMAIKEGRKGATNADFARILEQHYLGIRRSQSTPEETIKKRLAYYEAAKTVTSLLYPHAEPVLKTTILSKGDVGSQTVTNSTEDKLNYNKKELKALIVTSLAGREIEQMVFGGVSTSKSVYLTQNALKITNGQCDLYSCTLRRWL